ncbi:secreted RxLR effector protein 161-like [Cicer arietinum]|uniref:secreted RxLR effector protein 161-like n=1 Tax=Cicer arietinum TaxID=3827 RepID=UPI003CC6CCFB
MLSKEGNKELVDPTIFKQMIGSLRYLCNIRPDIAYSVRLVNKYMEKPRPPHYLATNKFLRYIKESRELGLLYHRDSNKDEVGLTNFTYVDWCGDKDDRKSATSYVFMMNESPISWCRRKQSIVALPTCEAEYVAASMGVCQALWWAELMIELGLGSDDAMKIKIENNQQYI